jgi:hypothetical protein
MRATTPTALINIARVQLKSTETIWNRLSELERVLKRYGQMGKFFLFIMIVGVGFLLVLAAMIIMM